MNSEFQGQEDLKRAKQALEAHREALMALPNVIGVGIGLKRVKGLTTGAVGLVVLVRQKVPAKELEEKDLIPAEIDGVPVDVQETGPIRANRSISTTH